MKAMKFLDSETPSSRTPRETEPMVREEHAPRVKGAEPTAAGWTETEGSVDSRGVHVGGGGEGLGVKGQMVTL